MKVSLARTTLVNEPGKGGEKPSCKNSRKELRRNCSPIGHNITKHFLCPIRSQHSLDCWKWSGKCRYPGALRSCVKTFVALFLPARLTAAGSLRMK